MKQAISRLTVAIAAVSMAFTPIAAQANTRASDSAMFFAAQGAAASEDDSEEGGIRRKGGWLWGDRGIFAAFFILAAIGGIVAVVGDSDDQSPGGPGNQSPGAN